MDLMRIDLLCQVHSALYKAQTRSNMRQIKRILDRKITHH